MEDSGDVYKNKYGGNIEVGGGKGMGVRTLIEEYYILTRRRG